MFPNFIWKNVPVIQSCRPSCNTFEIPICRLLYLKFAWGNVVDKDEKCELPRRMCDVIFLLSHHIGSCNILTTITNRLCHFHSFWERQVIIINRFAQCGVQLQHHVDVMWSTWIQPCVLECVCTTFNSFKSIINRITIHTCTWRFWYILHYFRWLGAKRFFPTLCFAVFRDVFPSYLFYNFP